MCSDDLKAALSPAREGINLDSASVCEQKCKVDMDTGMYELVGILTHMGRTADSGHYISWIRDRINSIVAPLFSSRSYLVEV